MSTPEPVDEQAPATVEVRGGNRPEDYVPAFLHPGEVIVPKGVQLELPLDEDE